ncbi:MAG: hypothetical protein ACKOTD_02435, partial [Phycisphaerales bacterium]
MRSRLDRATTPALGWILAMAACCAPAAAQFYEKVDLRRAPVERLRAALSADNQAIGASVAARAGIGDARLEPVFRGMARGDAPVQLADEGERRRRRGRGGRQEGRGVGRALGRGESAGRGAPPRVSSIVAAACEALGVSR